MSYETSPGKESVAAHQNIKERDYWLNKLSGIPGKSFFPYDHTTKKSQQKVTSIKSGFYPDLCTRLIKLSSGSDARLHMVLTAALVILVNKYTGSPDILLGTPIYKPDHEGKFINLVLPLRNKLRQDMSFKQVLLMVRETIINANENRNYPVELLPQQLNMITDNRDDSFPLFDTAILLENIHHKEYLNHINLSMIFSFLRKKECIEAEIHFHTHRYQAKTITRIFSHFTRLLTGALANIEIKTAHIDILSGEEKRQLIQEFNHTTAPYPTHKLLHSLVQDQVLKTPDRTAVMFRQKYLTYRELNTKANEQASLLRKMNVTPDAVVALMIDPSLEMIINILAILKAGPAYLPIRPDYPQSRILSMLQDSSAGLFITKDRLIKNHPYLPWQNFQKVDIKPFVTLSRAQVENLDSLQIPNRSLIDYEKYRPYIGQAMVKNSITIHMSRGCVYNCAFCFKIWPRKYIIRTAENIFNEIYFYYKIGIRRFAFVDDLPNINLAVSSKLFRLIIDNGLKVHLHFPNGIRGDILTKDYIDLMVEAGTITMDLALETTSPRLQKLIRKNLNLEKLAQNIEYITRKHPQVILELQILHGIPTETEEEALASLEFIKNIKWVHFPYIHILNIYPNSDMAKIAIENGIPAEAIEKSADIAYHELPDTLPFPKDFTRKYQTRFLNEYFLSKQRLLTVLPYQMKVLTEDELVQKYNSYLPTEIKHFSDLLELAGISPGEIKGEFLPPGYGTVPGLNQKLKAHFPQKVPGKKALNLLLLDLSQYFSHDGKIMYDVVEPPLGLMYLLTWLDKQLGSKINGKIAKSRIDFNSFARLKSLIHDFKPDVIGVRALNFYKDFFHKTLSLIRQWGIKAPIIAGGPYATSNYAVMLKDKNIDLAVLGEGEITLSELMGKIIENNGKLPDEKTLKKIPGLAFIEKKYIPKQQGLNRDILLLDRLPGLLSRGLAVNPPQVNQATDLAYIIYTSGSTGIPKGVLIQHNSVVNQVTGLVKRFHLDASYRYLLLASFTFDVSVMHIFSSLSTGAQLFLISDEIRKDSEKLWQFIYENKIDILNIVPAFMKVILQNIEKKKISFRYLFVGGDVFDKELYTRLKETFNAKEIINIYGPTETTINATLYQCRDKDLEMAEIIPIGKPLANYRIYILDNHLNPVPIGAKGELYIAGPGTSRGYLNRPELTAEKFCLRNPGGRFLKKLPPWTPHKNFSLKGTRGLAPLLYAPLLYAPLLYRTGDLARWLPDGNIEFLGRIDSQVKIRGYRIEVTEIEWHLKQHDTVKEAVVLVKQDESGDKYLSAYCVPISAASISASGLREYLAAKLQDYMIPSYFMSIEKIPLTPSGKLDQKSLPDPVKESSAVYAAPRNTTEEKLTLLWSEVLGVEKEKLSINDNFFELGGHSLKAAALRVLIHKELKVKLPLAELFKTPTIKGISGYIRGKTLQEKYLSIEPVEKQEYYAVSSAQKRLYILQRMHPESTLYNMTQVFPLAIGNQEDIKKIQDTFLKTIDRCESLRTSFHMLNEEPVQKVRDQGDLEFEIQQQQKGGNPGTSAPLSISAAAGIIKNFIRPFDLSHSPLLRVSLLPISGWEMLLLVDMHHITCDGISLDILRKDFNDLYAGRELPRLRLQYKDFSQWQIQPPQKQMIKQQETYWVKQFEGNIPTLELPTDYERPPEKNSKGDFLLYQEHHKLTTQLKKLARETETTLHIILLAAFTILLSKYSGQEDIVVGSAVTGRPHTDLQNIIGMFVNLVPMKNRVKTHKTFHEFLKEVKKNVIDGFDNQDYQFDDLVARLNPGREPGRNPLFDVVLNFQILEQPQPGNIETKEKPTPVQKPRWYAPEKATFDLVLGVTDMGNSMLFRLSYLTCLYTKETIETMYKHLIRILKEVIENPGKKISHIELLSREEKDKIEKTLKNKKNQPFITNSSEKTKVEVIFNF